MVATSKFKKTCFFQVRKYKIEQEVEVIEERTKQKMINKTKTRTIVEEKSEEKKYLHECDSDTVKDMIEITLHMWQVNCNYRDNTETKYQM